MFSESGSSSFCFMGVSSNSKVFLSDKDLKGVINNTDHHEVGLLVHKEGCQSLIQEDHQIIRLKQLSVQQRDQEEGDNKDDHHQEEQKQRRNNMIVTAKPVCPPINLKLEIPYSRVGSENDDDGLKTPTSSDHKIPVILECPGAPKKTKSKPDTKRKECRPRIVLDLSKDLESLFPMPHAVDVLGGGLKNKRVKQ
ncbi:hypothetical protein AAZX31_15G037900 [Glycine max]|nr:hypothetical protein GLYMA_15G038800v4 [Glycine max]KAG5104350.1 hypothetical protein JHK82_041320 [Glycine max]KAH1145450.1 hypothetical protein GYH30_041266 [Glycine max]